ncbi:MAG: quinol:cytochrome C oxidoreductase [Phycisphaerales bacterium]
MSQIAANSPAPDVTAVSDAQWAHRLESFANDARMHEDNINITKASASKIGLPMLVVGLLMLLVSGIGIFSISLKHTLAGLEIGIFTILAISLGSLFWTMVFHALNAGWSITLRRQFENLASLVWIPALCLIVIAIMEVTMGGILLTWLDPAVREGNHLLEIKAPYLNAPFFLIRVAIYAIAWIMFSRMLLRWSRKADETGDRALGRKARWWASLGIPVFAFSTTFCAFDFLMALDYRFFSTMWGVYFFASCALGSVSAVAIIAALLKSAGKLQGLVTEEHFHDLGKLVFAFIVFWAYVTFSQYFLIWYSNIPEETMWFIARKEMGYGWLFNVMLIGHFAAPFLVLIWRPIKRSPKLLSIMGAYLIVMIALDMAWIILPMITIKAAAGEATPSVPGHLIHVAAALGVVMIYGWAASRKLTKSPLIPTKDPMLHEALKHKNYV